VTRRQPEGWGAELPLLHVSITKVVEHDFVAMLLRDLHYRNSYLNIHGLEADDAVIWKDIPLRKFRKNVPGDVDILVVPKGNPEQSTAIQVKRYKLKIESDDAASPPSFGDCEVLPQAPSTAPRSKTHPAVAPARSFIPTIFEWYPMLLSGTSCAGTRSGIRLLTEL